MAKPMKSQKDALADLEDKHCGTVKLGGDGIYKGANKIHTFICTKKKHHSNWLALWKSVNSTGSGCPTCANKTPITSTKKGAPKTAPPPAIMPEKCPITLKPFPWE